MPFSTLIIDFSELFYTFNHSLLPKRKATGDQDTEFFLLLWHDDTLWWVILHVNLPRLWCPTFSLEHQFLHCCKGIVCCCCYRHNSLQLCLTLCDPRDGSPPGSSIPGILQARTLEWLAISFSNAWKWKVKVKSLRLSTWKLYSHVQLLATPWSAVYQAPPSMGFSRQEYWSCVPLLSERYCVDVDKTLVISWLWVKMDYSP